MAVALVANSNGASTGGGNSGGPVVTGSINTTGATLLLAMSSDYVGPGTGMAPGGPTVLDSKSNTWTVLTKYHCPDDNVQITVWYCSNPTVGTGHTATFAGWNNSCFFIAFSGLPSNPFDTENGGGGDSPGTSIQTGAITPASSGELLIVAASSSSATQVFTTDNSFTNGDAIDLVGGQHEGGYWAWHVQSVGNTIDPTISIGAGSNHIAVTIKAFRTIPPAFITLVKQVVGGQAPASTWTLVASGPSPLSGAGGVSRTSVNPGVYNLSETGAPGGYSAGPFKLTGSGGMLVLNQLTVNSGDDVTITIANTLCASRSSML